MRPLNLRVVGIVFSILSSIQTSKSIPVISYFVLVEVVVFGV